MTALTPERALWRAVLRQAFMDATSHPIGPGGLAIRRRATDWILRCGEDFRRACDFAGYEAEFLSAALAKGRVNGATLRKKGASR